MKKSVIFLIILFAMSSVLVTAQTNKGNFIVAGSSNLSFDLGKEKYKSEGTTEDWYSFFNLNFQPMAGYFFIDNLSAGLFIDLSIYSEKDAEDDDKYTETTFAIGPFARYYAFTSKYFKPFVHGQVGFGFYRDKEKYSGGSDYTYKEGYFTYLLGVGADYFLNDNVAIETLIGFNHDAYQEKESDGGERSDLPKYIYNSLAFRVGVVVIIGDN